MSAEQRDTFACFGGECTLIVTGGPVPGAALAGARARLLGWHHQFSRFEPGSELSRLNADPRETIKVSPMMRRVVAAAVSAARLTDGLVDPTLVDEIERAGYASHFEGPGLPLELSLAAAPARAPAQGNPAAPWRGVRTDRSASTVSRPPGLRLDPGGIAKGVFADELAASLSTRDAFVVDCAGDVLLGGSAGLPRDVHVASPFADEILHTFTLAEGAVATSGIGKRSWLTADGRPAHHLLDPASGRPAFAGVVQATALAPTAAEAEALSTAAVLTGPELASAWLAEHGGLIVLDDRSATAVRPRPRPDAMPPTQTDRRAPAAARAR